MKNDLNNFLNDIDSFKTIFDNIPLHIVITDVDGKIVIANKAVEKITGFTQKEIIGDNPRLWGKQMEASFYEEFWDHIKNKKKIFAGVVKNKKKNGLRYHAAAKVSPILNQDNKLIGFCGIEQEITDIQKLSDEYDLDHLQKEILERSKENYGRSK